MGISAMDISTLGQGIGTNKTFSFSIWLNGQESSDWYIVPAGVTHLTVTVSPQGGASCFVQTTTDPVTDVMNNRNVMGVDWGRGLVGVQTQDTTLGTVTAVRCIQTTISGLVKFTGVCS